MRACRPPYAVAFLALLVAVSVAFADKPIPVSPGRPDQVAQSAQRCPTFSWSLSPQAAAYKLVVYRVPEDRQAEPEAVIQQDLPAATSSWTPGLSQCLAPGETYGWRVAAVPVEGDAVWSEPSWFGVTGETALVSESLVELVAGRLLLRRQEEGERGGTPAGVRPAGAVPAPTIWVHAAAGPGVAFSVGSTGNVVGGAFFGDGSNLTGLNASNLASGTVPSGALSGSYSNALTLSNASNSFTGNGSGLTNLNLASIGGLTSGGVLFGSLTGTLAQSPTQLFWDQTNNRLGIGTNAPNQQLELTGMMRMPATAAAAGVPSAGVLFLGTDRFLHNYGSISTAGNTFVGQQAGNFTMTGRSNTASGHQSLLSNTTGYANTASGSQSLYSNTTGSDNTACGSWSLESNTNGGDNTASGTSSLGSNTGGYYNTASGAKSLRSNTTGLYNTASGYQSLYSNITGYSNTALGYAAGYNETDSNRLYIANAASPTLIYGRFDDQQVGINVITTSSSPTLGATLDVNGTIRAASWGTGSISVCKDGNGVLSACSGGSGSVTSVFSRTGNVVGAAGDYTASLVTNVPAGGIAATNVQGALNGLDTGKAAIVHTHTGSEITGLTSGGITFGNATGNLAQNASQLFWDQTNSRLGLGTSAPNQQLELTGMMRMPRTAATAGIPSAGVLFLGADRFLHNYGPASDAANTFIGQLAGNFTMGGSGSEGKFNTAIGYASLTANTTGYRNTASGFGSLIFNTTGYDNAASGFGSLYWNTTGFQNTASGYESLNSNTTGDSNTASGFQSLYSNTTGTRNTASAAGSLFSNTTGNQNTASGTASLYSNTTGYSNTASGVSAGYSNTTGYSNTASGIAAGYTNTTGTYNTFLGASSDAAADNLTNATAVGYNAKVNASNKVRIGNGSVTVIEGQVAWSWPSDARLKENIRELDLGLDFVLQLRPVSFTMKQGNGRTDMGFLAQDVEAVLGDHYNVLGIGADHDRTLSLRGTDLIAPMVKAIQEQQTTIQTQQALIEAQRQEIHAQESRIGRLERQLEALVVTRQPAVATGTEQPLAAAAREPTHLGAESGVAQPSSIRFPWPPGSSAARRGRASGQAGVEEETP